MLKCVFVINNLTIQIYRVFYYLPNYFIFFFKIFFSPDLISAARQYCVAELTQRKPAQLCSAESSLYCLASARQILSG